MPIRGPRQAASRLIATLAIAMSSPAIAVGNGVAPAYVRLDLPDRGGRLGLILDRKPYAIDGTHVVKVTGIFSGSQLFGTLHAGDLLYRINGFSLRSEADVAVIAGLAAPGTEARIEYLDSTRDFQPAAVSTRTIGLDTPPSSRSAIASRPISTPAPPPAPTPPKATASFCDDHPFICVIGTIVAAKVVVDALGDASDSDASPSAEPELQCQDVPSGVASDGGTLYRSECRRSYQHD